MEQRESNPNKKEIPQWANLFGDESYSGKTV